jgi:hypothetical protein
VSYDLQDAVGVDKRQIRLDRLNYRQPDVTRGMPVIWYRFNKPDHMPHVAFVQAHDKNSTIVAYVPNAPGGEVRRQCRHVSDPLLRLGHSLVDGGCWDFAPWYTDLIKTLVDIQSSLAELSRRMDVGGPARKEDAFRGGKRSTKEEKEE